MDPSKIQNLPSYSQFTPVEIIEIQGNHSNDNAGVRDEYLYLYSIDSIR